MDVSIVILTHNKKLELQRCLQAVLALQFSGDFEVLVCDDGSDDGAPALVQEWSKAEPRLRYLVQPQRGPAAGRNLGIRHAVPSASPRPRARRTMRLLGTPGTGLLGLARIPLTCDTPSSSRSSAVPRLLDRSHPLGAPHARRPTC